MSYKRLQTSHGLHKQLQTIVLAIGTGKLYPMNSSFKVNNIIIRLMLRDSFNWEDLYSQRLIHAQGKQYLVISLLIIQHTECA